MAKKKIEINLKSWGIYSKWEKGSKDLPKIKKFTDKVPAAENVEFGYILHIKGAKGKKIEFLIQHPPFTDEKGDVMPDFTGEYFVNSNDYSFYLGDMVWLPIEDKCGLWTMISYIDGKEIAKKHFQVVIGE